MKLPADLRLARARLYQLARRASLTLSLLVCIGVPLLHLARINAESNGLASGGWSRTAARLHVPDGPPPLVGAPWTVRVLGLELLDPLAGLGLLVAGAASSRLLVGALVTLVLVILFGRFFCGWICPYVPILAVSNAVRALAEYFGWRPPDVRLPRRSNLAVLLLVLAGTAATGSQLAPLIYPPSVIARELFRAVFFGSIGLGGIVIFAFFVFDSLVARAGFCRYLCPGGAVFTLLGALSPFRVKRTPSKCTDCTLCDVVCNLNQLPMTDRLDAGCERCGKCISVCPTGALEMSLGRPAGLVQLRPPPRPPASSPPASSPPASSSPASSSSPATPASGAGLERRELLTLTLLGLGEYGCGTVAGRGETRLPPPGALPPGSFERACIRCFRCAEVCPPKAIRFDSLLDLRGTDTPFVVAQSRACVLCMKCTQVCPTGALQPIPDDPIIVHGRVRMGEPVLNQGRCIAWKQSGVCRLCYYACPYPDQAVALSGPRQAPVFDASQCVGCGLCEEACPSQAQAIQILPLGRRG